jgi:peptidyl-prolyl cis-trans isomerase B (cyclophilin B)
MRTLILSMMLLLTSTLSFATENNMSGTHTKVKLTTTLGEIIIQLNTEKAPVSSANFLTYVNHAL